MISFVILNYKSIKDTIECIDSINKLDSKLNKSIIVVDNCSMTNEEKEIIKKYSNDVLFLEENYGFAKGNNIGSRYAVDKYKPDFLCVINSDTVIEQKDFINKIYDLYDKYRFDILGPKILPEYTESNNPFKVYKTLEEVTDRINYTKKLISIYKNVVLRNLLKLYINTKRIFKKQIKFKAIEEDVLGVPLHGCAMIFSKKYYEKYNDVFYNETFLFHEEEFLYYRITNDNLISLYSPSINLIHKEGQSLDKEFTNNYKKLIFRNEEILKSLELLRKVISNKEKI